MLVADAVKLKTKTKTESKKNPSRDGRNCLKLNYLPSAFTFSLPLSSHPPLSSPFPAHPPLPSFSLSLLTPLFQLGD